MAPLKTDLAKFWQLLRPFVRPHKQIILLIFLLGAITSLGQASQVLLIEPLVDVVLFPQDVGQEGADHAGDGRVGEGRVGEGNVASRAMLAFSGRVEASLAPSADHRLVMLLAIGAVVGASEAKPR